MMNLTAVLFIPVQTLYGFSYTHLGILVFINFVFQLLADILFSKPVDRFGFRPFTHAAPLGCFLGLIMFAAAPYWAADFLFIGLCIATAVFSALIGILEVILSPIINGLPAAHKESSMAILHSFLAWGMIAGIAGTTFMLFVFGIGSWQWVVLLWSVLPLAALFLFWGAYLPPTLPQKQLLSTGTLLKNRTFILSFLAIFFGAAAEITLMQWISTFLERGAGMSKVTGDILGLCGFALCFGLGRLIYSRYGKQWNIHSLMIYGSAVTIICYIIVALSPYTPLTLAACWVAGAATCLLWPETLVVAASALPMAGAVLFGLLAAGGDLGTAISSFLVGTAADLLMPLAPESLALTAEQFGLRAAILLGCVFPVLSVIFQVLLKRNITKQGNSH
jgi:predicted MFS family arabinose efflux permease